jgi:multiple sugar transport system ATP-binding protein
MSVETKNVSKTFFSLRRGKIDALKSINLKVEDGTFFVLLGPSGCGKSTLLNIIAGIEKNNSGEVWIGDKLVASAEKKMYLTPRERDIAMVFQSYALYPHMTVFENVAFPLKIAKTDKKEIRERVSASLKTLEISHLMEAKPAELSGGQRQRVALGRAIVRKPNLLLLDEPLSNLDALLRINMRSELKRIQRKLGVTTIYVTHDQMEAMSLGDKIAVLNEGQVQQIGTPHDIYKNPHNLFVAKFVGTPPMNLLDPEVLKEARMNISIENLDNLIVGIRPEHIKIVQQDEGILNGTIDLIGSQGSEDIVYIRINDHKILVKDSSSAQPDRIEEGAHVGIYFDNTDEFLFHRETGERMQHSE